MLPVVMITALDPGQERVKGIEAGADDFLTKPIHQPEILARVRSLSRIKSLYDELTELNRTLEQRVSEQVTQLERLSRLKRFFSPALAEAIVHGGADDPLKSHRREIVVVFLDLRGFTGRDRPRARRHPRALHRRRHDGVLQRPGARARSAGPRAAHGARDARRRRGADGSLAQARLRPAPGHGRRAGLCDAGRHRLRGPLGLWSHRHRDQPRGAALRRGARRPDPRLAPALYGGGGSGGGGAARRADAARLRTAGHCLQRASSASDHVTSERPPGARSHSIVGDTSGKPCPFQSRLCHRRSDFAIDASRDRARIWRRRCAHGGLVQNWHHTRW
ncbi:MAG: hypothetical protein DMD84_16105 [Candidatus Rokuibacteriota bacterium]|nr:MAG: hypothetical protein DMD84_16105 [Candidatus Rokubacteria bacterium]